MKSKLNRSETLASPFGGGQRGRTFSSLRILGVLVILLTIVLTSCNENNNQSKKIISKISNKEQIDTSIYIEGITFGRFCNECSGNCAPIIGYYNGGNANTLWGDFENNYFKNEDSLKFKTDLNTLENMNLANQIIDKIPNLLIKSSNKNFGRPDCTDGCGIYLKLWLNENPNTIIKKFKIDLHPNETTPREITEFAQFVSKNINQIIHNSKNDNSSSR